LVFGSPSIFLMMTIPIVSSIPVRLRLPFAVVLGAFFGLGAYAFYTSNAVSYLSDDPVVCVNCHIMTPQFVTWSHSSHREHAHCNDCHVPHDNLVNKYYFKAKDGSRHAALFTLRMERQAIRAEKASSAVIQKNCQRCHTREIERMMSTSGPRLCWGCHREVPHGRVRSLSSTPAAGMQLRTTPVPDWLAGE
jgi:cytochrome c nitrite reductase small subunit